MRDIAINDWLIEPIYPLFDVRSPSEFEKGHIPQAVSMPLFDDDERKEVGTLYKQVDPSRAMARGLEFAGPKMAEWVQFARSRAIDQTCSVCCWRGGQRSKSMAWLLDLAGLHVQRIHGGYKAFRKAMLSNIVDWNGPFLLLGGQTGAGKTAFLKHLRERGQQVLDLEALAEHKGSAFGMLGNDRQLSMEQFENNLGLAFQHLDPENVTWVESESRHIGKVYLHRNIWQQMCTAPIIHLEIDKTSRLERLLREYGDYPVPDLKAAFAKIKRRLGGLRYKQAIQALDNGALNEAAAIALEYYDKTYAHGLAQRPSHLVHALRIDEQHASDVVHQLIRMKQRLY